MLISTMIRLLSIGLLTLELLAGGRAGLVTARNLSATQPEDGAETAAEEAAIREVVLRTNAQQEEAIANHDASVMADSATDRYYRETVETNESLLGSGVIRIELVDLEWGPISVQGTRAEATTYETWAVTTREGRLVAPPERNRYRLLQEDGVWKIDANEHPDEPLPLPGRPAQT